MGVSMKRLTRFLKDRRGATAIEYALLASGIFLVIITAVTLLGGEVLALYQTISAGITTGVTPPGP
jgi:pilus assembly protein Flp/PilA